jgi:hypothetical protein
MMAPSAKTGRQSTTERAVFSPDFQLAVRAELDEVLKTPIFLQSNRCKRFLSFVVLQTLEGNGGDLKERTIGITVFDRTSDYDTGDDSIVRVTANEVRKRLGQYYGESNLPHPLQIELPRGSYVPEFRVQAAYRGPRAGEQPRLTPKRDDAEPLQTLPVNAPTAEGPAASASPRMMQASLPARNPSLGRLRYSAFFGLLTVAALIAFGVWKAPSNRAPDIWNAFLHARSPVLVCIDTHQLPAPAPAGSEGQKFVNMVLRKQIIALDDAAVLASMGATLGKKGIPFRVVGAEQTSLAELRRQPVILIGAIDNPWTMRLTRGLPYRIEVVNPPNTGASSEPIASIIDSQHPDTRWSTDLSVPFTAWKSDYALIVRVDDATTGVPVLIEAGLGNDGTIAASELIASEGLAPSLANESSCRYKSNFEAVIETQIIDTKSGPPHILRLTCW